MASIREASKQTRLNYGQEDTQYFVDNLKKMNSMLNEYSCSARLIVESNDTLFVSHCTPEEYEQTLKILGCHFDMKFNRKLELHSVPASEPVTAVIELDECTHQYVKCNIVSLNQKLDHECFNVSIALSEGYNLQIIGPDNATIEMAFNFIRSRLESLYNSNNMTASNHQPANASQYQHITSSPVPTDPVQSSHSSQESIDFCIKKWIVPDTLYDACQSKLDSIFNSHSCSYSLQATDTQNVIIEYEGSRDVIELIKSELEDVRKQYTALSQPSNISDYSSIPSDPKSYISYQDELDPSDVSLPPSPSPSPGDSHPETAQTEYLEYIQCQISLKETNPFYFDLHPNPPGADGMSKNKPGQQKISANPGFNNFPLIEPNTPAQDPMPQTEPPVMVPVPNEPYYVEISEIDNYAKQFQSPPTTISPGIHQSHTQPQIPSSSKSRSRNKENSLSEAMKGMPSSEPTVSTSSFNDPQVVSKLASIHLQDTDEQQQQQHKQQDRFSDTQEGRFSHQSLEAIIRYHDKFASVVKLPSEGSYQEARSLESSMLNVRFIQCPDQPRVCTVIADDKEMVLYALKELGKKFGNLGYLPACNGISVTSQGTSCFIELDDKPKETQKTKFLASLTCSSGLSIKIKSMNFLDGKWDAVVRSVEPNTISSTRLENTDILAVLGPNIDPAVGRRMAATAERLEYWCYYDARSKQGFCEHILYLVIPGWNPNDFKANNLKESIASILRYCNRQRFASVAFPIIGHESKQIPIPLSAQALLQAIDEFSSNCLSPSLKQVDIVITKESCIRAFQYHFITPIQRHLREHSLGKKCMTSEAAPEEEDACPICLEDLYTEGHGVRELVQCKHKFHDLCISKAIESKPRCPLCMSALGVQRGDQPRGGKMGHTVLFSPLPGYPLDGTIKINYEIPGGIQTASHPNPGAPYAPTNRSAYLPNNRQGQKVLELLKTAFNRGLIFTIGTSRTLGLDGVITWNDIHHKTMQTGQAHGYPDSGYLDRVLAELKDKGVE